MTCGWSNCHIKLCITISSREETFHRPQHDNNSNKLQPHLVSKLHFWRLRLYGPCQQLFIVHWARWESTATHLEKVNCLASPAFFFPRMEVGRKEKAPLERLRSNTVVLVLLWRPWLGHDTWLVIERFHFGSCPTVHQPFQVHWTRFKLVVFAPPPRSDRLTMRPASGDSGAGIWAWAQVRQERLITFFVFLSVDLRKFCDCRTWQLMESWRFT